MYWENGTNLLNAKFNELRMETYDFADILANDEILGAAMATGDNEKVKPFCENKLEFYPGFAVQVTDNAGKVIADLGSYGENVVNVQEPIVWAGTEIGTINVRYDITNPSYLDELKEMTGCEFTVFSGDTRINTTIMKDGERLLGTSLDPKVATTVIDNAESYVGKTEIDGEEHFCSYIPTKDANGVVRGVLFAGKNAEEALWQMKQVKALL